MNILRLALYLTTFIWTAAGSVALTQWLKSPVERVLPESGNAYYDYVEEHQTWSHGESLLPPYGQSLSTNPLLNSVEIGDEWYIDNARWEVRTVGCVFSPGEAGECRQEMKGTYNVQRSMDGNSMVIYDDHQVVTLVKKDDTRWQGFHTRRDYGGNQ